MKVIEMPSSRLDGSVLEIAWVFLRLGLSAFGGPVAHLAYFRDELVRRRQWLDEAGYAELVALCQFLPGPASSQVGLAVGWMRGGWRGALAAWAAFTLPSAALMIGFGLALVQLSLPSGGLHGLMLATVAVVAQAVWSMGQRLCPDVPRRALALACALVLLVWPSVATQLAVMALAGALAWLAGHRRHPLAQEASPTAPLKGAPAVPRWLAVAALMLLASMLLGLPLLAAAWHSPTLAVLDALFRSGALVLGGGHVVLPLLESALVPRGWVSAQDFLAGYGAVQMVPGPLFTFAAFVGTVTSPEVQGLGGIRGGLLALAMIFLPAVLWLLGVWPFWQGLRQRMGVQQALAGMNAAVVGVLLAALYDPVWTRAVTGPLDGVLVLGLTALLVSGRIPVLWGVALATLAGGVLGA